MRRVRSRKAAARRGPRRWTRVEIPGFAGVQPRRSAGSRRFPRHRPRERGSVSRPPALSVSPPERTRLTLVLGRRPRRHDPWVLGALLTPLLALLVAGSLFVRARLALGAWPTPAGPSAVELGMAVHRLAALLALHGILVSPLWTAGVFLVRWVLHGGRFRLAASVAGAACVWLVALAWIGMDPGACVAWAVGPGGARGPWAPWGWG